MMTVDDITVVTPTVGDSAGRLGILCAEMRRYTALPFKQIVCDDGTISPEQHEIRVSLIKHHGFEYFIHPGPTWGISYNLNYALSQVKTPWAFLIEDGVRPGWCWLEVAVDWLNKVGSKTFAGLPVGCGGMSSIQDWNVAMSGLWDVTAVFNGDRSQFYAGGAPGWNDGFWCWPRIMAATVERCRGDTSNWHGDLLHIKKIMLEQVDELKRELGHDFNIALQKWYGHDRWPRKRHVGEGRYPGPFLMINMDAWRAIGGFRDGCTFFEGHMGIRMQQHGFLTTVVESPPFVHCPSQGFSESGGARTPRHHEDTDDLFRRDFGYDHMQAPNMPEVINKVISDEQRAQAAREMAEVNLDCPEVWRKFL
jgi:hypothetical protein